MAKESSFKDYAAYVEEQPTEQDRDQTTQSQEVQQAQSASLDLQFPSREESQLVEENAENGQLSPSHEDLVSPAEEIPVEQRSDVSSTRSGQTSPTHSSHRTNLQKLIQEKRAKKVKFFRNGDKFFKGLLYALSLERIRSFDALLEDLTRVLVDKICLQKGVRYIFSVDGREKIHALEQLTEGSSYVCSSTDHFVKLDYLKIEKPNWIMTKKFPEFHTSKFEPAGTSRESRDFIVPKVITIFKSGVKPRKAVRMLLNKKTAHSFDQVLNDITAAIKLDTGAVRKIFTISGRQVMSLVDFFSEDIFIAYGPEKYAQDDFELDDEECRYLKHCMKNIGNLQKYKRSSEALSGQSPVSRRRVSSPFILNEGSPSNSSQSSYCSSPLYPPSSYHTPNQSAAELLNGHIVTPASQLPAEIILKYDIGKVIGDGNFSVVHECTNKLTKVEYALKVIDKTKCKGKENMIKSEVAILRRVKHMHIVQLIEEFDFENELYLVMELVKGGDLFDSIRTATKYSEKDARLVIHNLCSALCYLHSLNIVHRDIKPENLLVVQHEDGTRSLKLGDFGLAVEVTEPLLTICGTPTYVAPEILAEIGYGLKVDIWAAGVIMYILLCGFAPFTSASNNQAELFDQILSGRFEFTSPFWDEISDSAKDLITKMLEIYPEHRYAAAEVLEHPWVHSNIAPDSDMQSAVSREITVHFNHKPKNSIKTAAGIALIAVTALDKKKHYF